MCGVFVQLSQSPSAALGSMSGHGKIASTQKAASLQGNGKEPGTRTKRPTEKPRCAYFTATNKMQPHIYATFVFSSRSRERISKYLEAPMSGLLGRVHRRVRGVLHSRARKRLVDHPSRPMGLDGLGYNGTR
jgi:hypothetical protein